MMSDHQVLSETLVVYMKFGEGTLKDGYSHISLQPSRKRAETVLIPFPSEERQQLHT